MKQFFLLFILLIPASLYSQQRNGTIHANSNRTQSECYFKENVLLLDPIEGIYNLDIQTKVQAGNSSRELSDSRTVIIKKVSDGKFEVLGFDIVFERIGETNAYTFTYYSKIEERQKSMQITLNNSATSMIFSTRDRYMRDAYRDDMYSFIKQYPTYSIYADARNLEAKKAEDRIKKELEKMPWTGTGFALNDGYIVTNYHVIEDAKTISIKGIKGDFNKSYNGTVVGADKHNDLALIKITDSHFNGFDQVPYKIKTALSDVGEDVFVLGYPLTTTMGDEIKLTTGVVSSKTGFQGDITLYQISAPIQPGNSGGPLFDNDGNVIGIVNAKHNGADNVGYAIKSMYLRNLIESVVSSSIIPINNHISTKTLPEKVKSLDDYIFLIECSRIDTL